MKNTVLWSAVTVMLLAASCKKSNNNNTGTTQTFTVDNASYLVTSVVRSGSGQFNLTASSVNGSVTNSVVFWFNGTTVPTAGNYPAVQLPLPVGPNEVGVVTTLTDGMGTSKSYYSNGAGTVTVSVNNGKLTINAQGLVVRTGDNSASAKLSASFSEK